MGVYKFLRNEYIVLRELSIFGEDCFFVISYVGLQFFNMGFGCKYFEIKDFILVFSMSREGNFFGIFFLELRRK